MCNLCCVTSTETTGIPVEDESMQDCFGECIESFAKTEDVVLAVGNVKAKDLEKSLKLPDPNPPKPKF